MGVGRPESGRAAGDPRSRHGVLALSRRPERQGPTSGLPRFKAKGRCRASFRVSRDQIGPLRDAQGERTGTEIRRRFPVEPRRVQIPRIGWVHLKEDPTPRIGDSRITSVTLSREADRWYAVSSPSRQSVRRGWEDLTGRSNACGLPSGGRKAQLDGDARDHEPIGTGRIMRVVCGRPGDQSLRPTEPATVRHRRARVRRGPASPWGRRCTGRR